MVKVRSDRAPELIKAIARLGVIHELTAADTPEQNVKVERMNRTIVTKLVQCWQGQVFRKDHRHKLWRKHVTGETLHHLSTVKSHLMSCGVVSDQMFSI